MRMPLNMIPSLIVQTVQVWPTRVSQKKGYPEKNTGYQYKAMVINT
jgi:hypothetical protein